MTGPEPPGNGSSPTSAKPARTPHDTEVVSLTPVQTMHEASSTSVLFRTH